MADKKQPGWTNPLGKTEPASPEPTGMIPDAWLGRKDAGTVEAVEITPPWPADNSDLDAGSVRPSGVGLREGEIAALDAIAARYDIARNALLRLGARRLIMDFRAGRLDLSELVAPKAPKREPKLRIKYPSK